MSASPRQIALDALRDWDDTSRYADEILAAQTKKHLLAGSNRALVQELFYGTLRRLETVDFVIEALRRGKISHQALWVLRLGVYQLLHTEIAEHAVVNETVRLIGKNQRGFANAIFRNTQRKKDEFLAQIAAQPLAIRESHPEFLIERWTDQHGEAATEAICQWNNKPAPVYARLNPLADPEQINRVRSEIEPSSFVNDDFFQIKGGPVHPDWIAEGLVYIQDPGTAGACELLAAKPGETILDACAAPGGKTALLAAAMQNEGKIIAADCSEKRIGRLRENLDRLHVSNTEIRQIDWLGDDHGELPEFDAILVDAPCSNTGVMRRRVDVRWRLQPQEFQQHANTQLAICEAVLQHLKPGGRLIYSTCSIDREENEAVIDRLLENRDDLARLGSHQTLPWTDGFDGSFARAICLA